MLVVFVGGGGVTAAGGGTLVAGRRPGGTGSNSRAATANGAAAGLVAANRVSRCESHALTRSQHARERVRSKRGTTYVGIPWPRWSATGSSRAIVSAGAGVAGWVWVARF